MIGTPGHLSGLSGVSRKWVAIPGKVLTASLQLVSLRCSDPMRAFLSFVLASLFSVAASGQSTQTIAPQTVEITSDTLRLKLSYGSR